MSKIPIAIDVETTIFAKGNPFAQRNKCVLIGVLRDGVTTYYDSDNIRNFVLPDDHIVLTFNGKFDLNWLRRCGVDTSNWNIWDCQLAHFMYTGQTHAYPSLNEVAAFYNLGQKIDTIKEKYWDEGIDTDQIPIDELKEYLSQDLALTHKVFEKQSCGFPSNKMFNIFRIQCRDLVALHDMEFNGLKFDISKAREMEIALAHEIHALETYIKMQYSLNIKDVCWSGFNFNSHEHLHALLYGGKIREIQRLPNGHFKSGARTGQTKYKRVEVIHEFPSLFESSQLRVRGTDKVYLQMCISAIEENIKNGTEGKNDVVILGILKALISRSKKNKILGTYLKGLITLIEEKDWKDGCLHPNYNQCVVKTGRLSSSSPNGQNLSGDILNLITSRYDV